MRLTLAKLPLVEIFADGSTMTLSQPFGTAPFICSDQIGIEHPAGRGMSVKASDNAHPSNKRPIHLTCGRTVQNTNRVNESAPHEQRKP
jgi:hypothetical protein